MARYVNTYITPQDLKITRIILPSQTNKYGESIVYLRLRRYDPHKRKDVKEKRLSTNIRVNPKFWSSKKGEILKGDFNYQQKNRLIADKESQIRNYINNPSVDYQLAQLKKEEFLKIEEIFPSNKLLKFKTSLVDYIQKYYDRRKSLNHKHGTIKEFKTVMNRIKKFDDSRNKKTYLKEINISWSDDFELWLTKQDYAKGTIGKSYTILVTILYYLWEIRDERNIEMTDKFQSKRFKRGDKSKNKPYPLTEAQLMAIYNHRFKEKHLEKVKKMILIQCFSGIRYGDIGRLRSENIQDNFLVFTPKKTEQYEIEVEQPLNPYLKSLLEEVNFDTSCYKMQNQPYNRVIKEVLVQLAKKEEYKKLKFNTDHTSHNFRDTFISLAVAKGVNWKSILKWVGQSSYKIMDRYIHLSRPFDKSEMKKLYK